MGRRDASGACEMTPQDELVAHDHVRAALAALGYEVKP